jgi:hypothetical protein
VPLLANFFRVLSSLALQEAPSLDGRLAIIISKCKQPANDTRWEAVQHPLLMKFGLISPNVSSPDGSNRGVSPVWAVNEISKQLPLPTSGGCHVLQGADAAVRTPLPYQPEIPVARGG